MDEADSSNPLYKTVPELAVESSAAKLKTHFFEKWGKLFKDQYVVDYSPPTYRKSYEANRPHRVNNKPDVIPLIGGGEIRLGALITERGTLLGTKKIETRSLVIGMTMQNRRGQMTEYPDFTVDSHIQVLGRADGSGLLTVEEEHECMRVLSQLQARDIDYPKISTIELAVPQALRVLNMMPKQPTNLQP